MKKIKSLLVLVVLLFTAAQAAAQKVADSITANATTVYVVIKNDGTQFVGKLISMDAREVVLETKEIGAVSIPKHEIKELRKATTDEITAKGEFKPSEIFATRYFITTNGLPIAKGESYVLWNWYGPEIQFGVAKNLSIGIMTSWLAMPVVGAVKYSIELDANTHLGIGTLLGTGSWALPKFGIALPFGSLTYGNRRTNISFSGGYGAVWSGGYSGGRSLFSVAGMMKVSKKASLVFDSFIMPGNTGNQDYVALYMPGLRIQTASNKAFQFGFAGISTTGGTIPVPMFQWFRML